MQSKETSLIDPRLSDELQKLYDKLYAENKLVVGEKLNGYYETFRNKFGPDKLQALDGEELLFTMISLGTSRSRATGSATKPTSVSHRTTHC